jgi:hypothetical protein
MKVPGRKADSICRSIGSALLRGFVFIRRSRRLVASRQFATYASSWRAEPRITANKRNEAGLAASFRLIAEGCRKRGRFPAGWCSSFVIELQPVAGMWKDREDVADSVEYINRLRRELHR